MTLNCPRCHNNTGNVQKHDDSYLIQCYGCGTQYELLPVKSEPTPKPASKPIRGLADLAAAKPKWLSSPSQKEKEDLDLGPPNESAD